MQKLSKQLREVVLSACRDEGDLEILAYDAFGQRLSEIARGRNLKQAAFRLLQWAEARSKFADLVAVLLEEVPENPELLKLTDLLVVLLEEEPENPELQKIWEVLSGSDRPVPKNEVAPKNKAATATQATPPPAPIPTIHIERAVIHGGLAGRDYSGNVVHRHGIAPRGERAEEAFPGVSLEVFSFSTVRLDRYGAIVEEKCCRARQFVEDLGNGVQLEMVEIPAGRFLMGSPTGEEGRRDSEGPQHWVTVPSFYFGKYAVTQEQWEAIADSNPSFFNGKKLPVEKVSWREAAEFCQKLSQKTGREYRLPSEAEWEYACRAGTMTPFYSGETLTADIANYRATTTYASAPTGPYRKRTTDVGSFPPNAFGLYDMHGNVWEWCADGWHESYENAPSDTTVWLDSDRSPSRVLRGGSWSYSPRGCRSACRYQYHSVRRYDFLGFRVVCGPLRILDP